MRTILLIISLFGCIGPMAAGAESLSLDGTWQILFDRHNEGRDARWIDEQVFSAQPARRDIAVPSCWEEIEKDYEGVAYYRRAFNVPAAWRGKTIRLEFGAVNFIAEVWLNGQAIGYHEGGFTPFAFQVDQVITPGEENVLTMRVAGPILMTSQRIEGIGPMETPQWRGAITGGIWQPVRLLASDEVYVDDVFIEPKLPQRTAVMHVELKHAGTSAKDVSVAISIAPAGGGASVARATGAWRVEPGSNRRTWSLALQSARLWSPDDPHLYRATVVVSDGAAVCDRFSTRFGMREFTIRDGQFHLNGKPVYLKATFFEGLYPTRLAYPDSREMAVREITLAKEAGFNMIRPWRKPPPPMWLDLADEMGVMTVGSMAIECMGMPVESARLPGWVANEIGESILRDRNRACVVQWELFNELQRPVLKQMLRPMSVLARQLDPTRLVLDESGGWAQGARSYRPYENEPTLFNDIHHYPGPQINEDVYNQCLIIGKTPEQRRAMGIELRVPGRNVLPELMSYVSELGYGSLPNLVDNNARFRQEGNPLVPPTVYHARLAAEQTRALEESGLNEVYADLERYCLDQQKIHGAANRRMIEAVRSNSDIQGYCVHALTDGDWIVGAGLLDLFRQPKTYAYEGTKAANQPRIVAIRVRPRNVYARQGARLEITAVNDLAAVAASLRVEVVAPSGEVVLARRQPLELKHGISQIFDERLATASLDGTFQVHATLVAADGSTLAENVYPFDVFSDSDLAAADVPVAVVDPGRQLKPFLDRSGIRYRDFGASTDTAIPVLVAGPAAGRKPGPLPDGLASFMHGGGTVVHLPAAAPPGQNKPAGDTLSALLGAPVVTKPAQGLWNCIPHIVCPHQVFEGLPSRCMMGPVYENVWAQNTLIGVGGEVVVGAVGYDWYPDMDHMKRHYYGPGDSWWGADLAVVPRGRGRLVVSQLRLLKNLGNDPVADRLLYNLIRYAATPEGKASGR